MAGYNARYSVTMIEELLESKILAKKKGILSQGEIQNAIKEPAHLRITNMKTQV